jgi:hypothetical protein
MTLGAAVEEPGEDLDRPQGRRSLRVSSSGPRLQDVPSDSGVSFGVETRQFEW